MNTCPRCHSVVVRHPHDCTRSTPNRITAADAGETLTVSYAGAITASTTTRTLAGPIAKPGVYGRTSRGRLKVDPAGMRFPSDLTRVKLTKEHDRADSRGYLSAVAVEPDGTIRAAMKVSDGPAGDAALQEAKDKTRDGFSFDVVDAVVDGDTITSCLVVAIGQVGIPAYDDFRIDTIAASAAGTTTTTTTKGHTMTDEERARLTELRAKQTLTQEEAAELATLAAKEEAGAPAGETGGETGTEPGTGGATAAAPPAGRIAASIPAVPSGVPSPGARPAARTAPRGGALAAFVQTIVDGYANKSPQSITAALNDVTETAHGVNVAAPGWSAELWSGVQYEQEFVPLLNSGPLTNWEGKGWRWVTKPEMQDYAGDKAAIPTDTPDTEPATYEAARMAVGHDIDRKFYDFPDAAFLTSYVEAVRESWAVKTDDKARVWIEANAVAAGTGAGTVLKAAARAALAVKRARLGRATFVVVADADFEDLMDVTTQQVPAFLDMYNIDPRNFVSSPSLTAGTVIAGVKQAATFRQLPGSPIRVSAQHIANGGIDEGFFGYWAIEEHHTTAIKKVTVA